MNQKKRVMIVAGGSGGHVFPGLSVAHYLINSGFRVVWLGTKNNIEAKLVPKHGIDIEFICIKGWCGQKLYVKCIMPFLVCLAAYQAIKIIRRWKPDIMLGMGGYVSGPSGLAAWLSHVPLIIHEQNSVFGLTNRYLSMFAKQVLQGLPDVSSSNILKKIVGNPVRSEILSVPRPVIRWRNRVGPIRVLVIGGSHGANILNSVIPDVAKKLFNKLVIWHQSGEKDFQKVTCAYQKIKKNNHKVFKFIDNVAQAYAWADILISRAGALTVSEVSIVGLSVIFVPFAYHKDHQQYWNAMFLKKVGAAKIIEQKNFTVDYVCSILESWDRNKLFSMAQRARIVAIPDATKRVSQIIIEYLKEKCINN